MINFIKLEEEISDRKVINNLKKKEDKFVFSKIFLDENIKLFKIEERTARNIC